ncbi:MFS transporter [Clostridiaceae bacterium M8S5]|nr:MFS transporter [Clostridiaceae bacterium M8S5]
MDKIGEISVDNRNIMLYLSGKFVSMFGTNVYTFAISLYLLKLTGGISFSINFALNTVPRLVLGPIAGFFSDKFSKKKIVILTDLVSGILLIALYIYSSINTLNPIPIYITTVLLTSFNTIFFITISSAIPTLVSNDSLIKINSYDSSVNSLSNIIGPLAGGFLFGLFNIKYIILINGISFILSALSECFIDFKTYAKMKTTQADKEKSSFIKEFKDVLRFLKSQTSLLIMTLTSPLLNFIFVSVNICVPFIVIRKLSMSGKAYGSIEAIFAIGMLVMSLLFSRIKDIKKPGLYVGISMVSNGILIALLGLPSSSFLANKTALYYTIFYCVIHFMLGCFMVIINMPIQLVLQRKVPNDYLGKFYGIVGTISGSMIPLSAILYGFLIERVNNLILLLISGLIMSMVGLYYCLRKSMHEL